MKKYQLKPGFPAFVVMDGHYKGMYYRHEVKYDEVPPQYKEQRFDAVEIQCSEEMPFGRKPPKRQRVRVRKEEPNDQ